MISYLDLADSTGSPVRFHGDGQPNRRVTNVTGLPGVTGFSGARDSTYSRPSGHGSITRSRWQQAGLVTVEGVVLADDQDQLVEAMDALRIPLLDALDSPALLTWQRGVDGTGVELQAYARLTGNDVSVAKDGPRVLRYQANLRLDDPRGYTQTLSSAVGTGLAGLGGDVLPDIFPDTFDSTAGGSVAVDNTGTRATPGVFRVYGAAEDPQIVLVETGARIVLSGSIDAGDYLEVDVAARTVRLNGTSPAQGMIVSASTTWFEIPRGTSTLRMLAVSNDAGAHLEVDYRSAYA